MALVQHSSPVACRLPPAAAAAGWLICRTGPSSNTDTMVLSPLLATTDKAAMEEADDQPNRPAAASTAPGEYPGAPPVRWLTVRSAASRPAARLPSWRAGRGTGI